MVILRGVRDVEKGACANDLRALGVRGRDTSTRRLFEGRGGVSTLSRWGQLLFPLLSRWGEGFCEVGVCLGDGCLRWCHIVSPHRGLAGRGFGGQCSGCCVLSGGGRLAVLGETTAFACHWGRHRFMRWASFLRQRDRSGDREQAGFDLICCDAVAVFTNFDPDQAEIM